MSPLTVPTVDISSFNGSPRERGELLEAVDTAYTHIGFLEVVGHGVPPALIASMQNVTTDFFDQPMETKSAYITAPETNRGYSPPGAEALSYSAGLETPPDLFQAFNAGAQIHTVDPATRPEHHASLYHGNVWPDSPPAMQTTWEEYIAVVSALAQQMLRVLAGAVGVDDEFFADRADQAPDVLRALDYRHVAASEVQPGQMRLGAHSDYGMCTMLYADPVPGLQILGLDDTWHDVVPTPGAYLVNIGDMLAAWTNDRWRSTVHRVVPAQGSEPVHRRSLAYFHEANPDAMIEPLESCIGDGNPPRYEPISAGDHLHAKIVSPRSMQLTTAVQTTSDRADALAPSTET